MERKCKIGDAVGAVAVHGYAGFFGVVVVGFVLWGYPSSPNTDYASINPAGQFIGAVIMFGVLGFLPGWGISRMLLRLGVLRVPSEIEIAGLDTVFNIETAEDELIRDADNSLLVRHRAAWSRYMTGNHVVA